MTSRRDNEEPNEGIQIDLPFLSFRAVRGTWAWGLKMSGDDAYERARRRVRARLSFYRHLATYAAIIGAILFLDLVTGGGISNVVLWVAGIWGGLLVFQAANTFVFPVVWSRETEERMSQEELRRHQDEP